jgi:hypothetical protein
MEQYKKEDLRQTLSCITITNGPQISQETVDNSSVLATMESVGQSMNLMKVACHHR